MKLQYTPTADDYVLATRTVLVKGLERLWTFSLVYVLVLPAFVYTVVLDPTLTVIWTWFGAFAVFLLIFPLFLLLILALNARQIRAQVRANPQMIEPVTWELDDERVHIQTALSEAKLAWVAFTHAGETTSYYFLVYAQNKNVVQFLPRRTFTGQGPDEAAFRSFLEGRFGALRNMGVRLTFKLSLVLLGLLYAAVLAALLYALSQALV
jgi:hypothetical protein